MSEEQQNIYLIKTLLEKNGSDVVAARNGQEDIDKVSPVNPSKELNP